MKEVSPEYINDLKDLLNEPSVRKIYIFNGYNYDDSILITKIPVAVDKYRIEVRKRKEIRASIYADRIDMRNDGLICVNHGDIVGFVTPIFGHIIGYKNISVVFDKTY